MYLYTTYLISPLTSVVKVPNYEKMDVYNFRFAIRKALSKYNINILDPIDMEKINVNMSVEEYTSILTSLKREAVKKAEAGEIYNDIIKDIAYLTDPITKGDLQFVRSSNFLIGYAHGNYPTIGMVDEIAQARFCNIPVYMMIEEYDKISSWLTAMVYDTSGRIFLGPNRINECINFIKKQYFDDHTPSEHKLLLEKYKKLFIKEEKK